MGFSSVFLEVYRLENRAYVLFAGILIFFSRFFSLLDFEELGLPSLHTGAATIHLEISAPELGLASCN